MNNIFRVIWNGVLQRYVVASELAKGKVKASSSSDTARHNVNGAFALSCLAIAVIMQPAQAASGSIIVDGVATTVTGMEVVATGNRATVGQNSMGLSAANGGSIDFSNGSLTTSGTGGLGAIANNGSTIVLNNTDIVTSGNQAHGLVGQANSTITGDKVSIKTSNTQAHGIQSIGSAVTLTNSIISASGSSANGALAQSGGKIALTHSTVNTSDETSYALYALNGGQIDLSNSTLSATGHMSYAAFAKGAGSVININSSTLSTAGSSSEAVFARDGGNINLTNTDISTALINGYGLRAFGKGSVVNFDGGTITTLGASNSAQAYGDGSEVNVRNAVFNTARTGLAATNGKVVAENVTINNTGTQATTDAPSISLISGYSTGQTYITNAVVNNNGVNQEGARVFGGAMMDLNNVQFNIASNGIGLGAIDNSALTGNNVSVNITSQDDLDTSRGLRMGRSNGDNLISLSNSSVVLQGANSIGAQFKSDAVSTNTLGLTNSILSAAQGTALQVSDLADTVINADSSLIEGTTLLTAGVDNAGTLSNVTLNGDNGSQFKGDVVIDRASTATNAINLSNGSAWTGSTATLEDLNLTTGSQWNVTSSSAINNLTLDNSTLNMTAPGTGFSQVTVGNLTSNNGVLDFKTHLLDDSSQTDHLLITGDYSGNSNVMVQNAGGTGAQTLNGIELIRVDGAINGTFTQQGRIVAGAYDYHLVQDANKWLLESDVINAGGNPGEGEGDASVIGNPVKGTPITRPEAASYAANLAAANNLFTTTLDDRLGETRYIDSEGHQQVSSMWLRNAGGHNRFGDSSGQLKTTSNRYVMQLGGDIARSDDDQLRLGVMGGYANAHSNTQSAVTGHAAKGEVSGYSAGLYATWLQDSANESGAFVDSWMLYNWFDNSVKGDDIAAESYKSKGITAAVETGYTFKVAQLTPREGVYLQPKAQLAWQGVKANDHQEENGTRVSGEGNNNLQTRLGVRALLKGHSALDEGKGRTFEPFIEANWVHNTEAFGSNMNGVTVQQAGASNLAEMKVGVDAKLNNTVNLWGNVGQQLGNKSYSDTSATVGVKISF